MPTKAGERLKFDTGTAEVVVTKGGDATIEFDASGGGALQVEQCVSVSHHHGSFGDQSDRRFRAGEQLEALPGEAVVSFDRLVAVGVARQVDRAADILRMAKLLFQMLDQAAAGDQVEGGVDHGIGVQPPGAGGKRAGWRGSGHRSIVAKLTS